MLLYAFVCLPRQRGEDPNYATNAHKASTKGCEGTCKG